ncbi:MAG: hypothetical protein HC884_17310 [Chloroflexaceae bacterium]|nr:hypothetical protein [Chloroflexaceae bacterium]
MSTTEQKSKGWFGRNWKWCLPVGCLGVTVPIIACIALVFFGVFGALKSSEVYLAALERAQQDPRVTSELGTPIEPGMMVSGSISFDGSSGNADLSIPLTGPNNSGTLHVVAEKRGETWNYSVMEVTVEGKMEPINLLE